MKNTKLNNRAPLFSTMHVALLLLCAVLLSSYAIGGLYARYTSEQGNGDDARVAKFAFDENLTTSQSFTLIPSNLAPGEEYKQPISITNNGEVAIRCVVKFENMTNNLPLECKIEGTTETYVDIPVGKNANANFNLVISWPAEKNSPDYAGKTDLIRITVTVEQVD